VSESHADAVIDYILRQEEHHAAESFQQELLRLHAESRTAHDERFMWD